MQQEAEWLLGDLGESEAESGLQEKYKFFMRAEPQESLGPIQVDESNGLRFRLMKVGMMRNAKDENRKEMKVYLDPIPHVVQDDAKPLQGWYQSKFNESPLARPRPCFTDAILTQPYGGACWVGCAFCYINAGMRGYRGSGLVTVPRNYGAQVATQLKRMRTSSAGYFSSFTDPFMSLENYYHNTQAGATAFVNEGLPVFFLSRLSYPGWAYDLLKKSKYSYAQKSINTPDPDDWQKLSPGALPLMDHLDEIRELRRQGIYVSIQCNPVVAGIVTHEDIERLIGMLAEAGANHVIVKFVEAAYSWVPAMIEKMVKRFGDNRAAYFKELFVQNIGGERTIAEEYRMEGHRRYRAAAQRAGITYATCYEYAYDRDAEGNITSKVGHSVGKEFLTADQCHGHRVPMFSRAELDEPFHEVADCPPTGCLTCADDNGGAPRCGSTLFGQAKALRMSDLKKPVYGS